MEEQLRRIKNKDISTLDSRLFGNLDKVESISSTIQNLGHFQKFLLTQISQFQEKAKNNKQNKQLTEVIEQNCMTLRQSIMRVVPEIQNQKSRLRESVLSPINGFRSTGFQKFNKDAIHENEKFSQKERLCLRKIEQMQQLKKKMTIKFENLQSQIIEIKKQKSKLKIQIDQVFPSIRKYLQKQIQKQLNSALTNSKRLQTQCKLLKKQKQQLAEQNKTLQTQITKLKEETVNKKQKQLQNLFQHQLSLQNKTQCLSSLSLRRSTLKENDCNSRSKVIQNYLQKTTSNQTQYKSFMDKIKFDFTSKLSSLYENDAKTIPQSQSKKNQKSPDTFRKSTASQIQKLQINSSTKFPFRSVQIQRVQEPQLDHNVPKLLRRNSITHQYHSSSISQQSLGSKKSLPLQQIKSNYQSHEKNYERQESKQCHSTSKKSNHDLMRKTKSNFFKQPVENKQNAPNPLCDNFYDTSIAKMKGLVSECDSSKKRNSQSKQKLKIFSMI